MPPASCLIPSARLSACGGRTESRPSPAAAPASARRTSPRTSVRRLDESESLKRRAGRNRSGFIVSNAGPPGERRSETDGVFGRLSACRVVEIGEHRPSGPDLSCQPVGPILERVRLVPAAVLWAAMKPDVRQRTDRKALGFGALHIVETQRHAEALEQ